MRVALSWSVLWLTLATAPWKSQGAAVPWPAADCKHPGVLALERAGDFEGDILRPRDNSADRNAVTKKDRLWPGGIIPYVIDAQLNRTTKKILRAMANIQSKSCLRFVARRKHENYLHIMRGDGCSSPVGRRGGAQKLSLGRDCLYQGIIVHELTHAVGFAHEHSRSDRDQYIDVFTENAESGRANDAEAADVRRSHHPACRSGSRCRAVRRAEGPAAFLHHERKGTPSARSTMVASHPTRLEPYFQAQCYSQVGRFCLFQTARSSRQVPEFVSGRTGDNYRRKSDIVPERR
ncbi:zinc metalloproteinase nas-4-like isoform X1 [Dermacentor albipictus]|uniref:zinc metalloproteinase nas-4-like isoform X1 n=1 Tax=Dermacentor albipictus TaxID=60249 RepID=UPI0031FDD748